jgi:hypothetical protein
MQDRADLRAFDDQLWPAASLSEKSSIVSAKTPARTSTTTFVYQMCLKSVPCMLQDLSCIVIHRLILCLSRI